MRTPLGTYEHWTDDDGDTLVPADADPAHRPPLGPNARLCCTIHAESWEKAMRLYHEHMGWEPYRPTEDTPCP